LGSPISVLRGARAFARDFARDQMPPGYLWDVVDYVPAIIDAGLTGRGPWLWGSTAMGGDAETGIYAPYSTGDKLLIQATNGHLYDVGLGTPYTATDCGAIPRGRQNPVQLVDTVIALDGSSASAPKLITSPSGTPVIGAIATGHKNAPLGCIYKSMLVTAAAPGELDTVRFSNTNATGLTDPASYDPNSYARTSLQVTAIAALRSVILVFHAGSVERIRGATPPRSPSSGGDMFLESLFDRAGCSDPLTIAYWNDNCIFADSHGVHMTDGSIVRNLASQGGVLTYWRSLYALKQSMCGTTYLDYYIVTVRGTDGSFNTLVCDLNRRQWFRFTNLDALCWIASESGVSMERIWAGMYGTNRLARVGPCFFPTFTTSQIQDDDGTVVLPSFDTPWYRLAQEGRKRIRFGYLSYDVRASGVAPFDELVGLAVQQILQMGYIRSPQQSTYTTLGTFPSTGGYTRYRLPLGQFPYGVAFRVQQLLPSTVTRVFDLAVEAQGAERSRV